MARSTAGSTSVWSGPASSDEFIVSTWAEHLRQNMRLTVDETKAIDAAWDMHTGDSDPVVRHYLASQRAVRLYGYGISGRTFSGTPNWPRPRTGG